jgi:hypothetical protein
MKDLPYFIALALIALILSVIAWVFREPKE